METLLIEYAKRFGMDKALQMLGLDKQTQNPKYTFGMPFTNNKISINPMRMIANQGIKSMMGGSSMGMALPLIAGGLGLAYLRNPLRPGSMNYMPGLEQELKFAAERGYLDGNKYGGDSILSGQNAVSMFGTNSYLGQLEKYRNKYEDTMPTSRLKQLNDEIAEAKNFTSKKNKTKNYGPYKDNNNDGGNGGGSFDTSKPGSEGAFGTYDGSKGRKDYGRGGIASL